MHSARLLAATIVAFGLIALTKICPVAAAPLDGCKQLESSFVVEQNSTIVIPFANIPVASPKPTDKASAPLPVPSGANLVNGTIVYDLGRVRYTVSATSAPSPTPSPTPPNEGSLQAATPAPSASPTTIQVGGTDSDITATVLHGDIATLVKGSPSGTSSASPSGIGANPFSVQVMGLYPGKTPIEVRSGSVCSYVFVRVVPPNNSRFEITTGIGASNLPTTTYTSAPSLIASSPGTNVFKTEQSSGQLFLPILASYRFTTFASDFLNLSLTGGFAATGSNGRQLYGLSLGNEQFLLTFGFHSDELSVLEPGVRVGTTNTLLNGAPITYSQRTTRAFAALTFSLCEFASFLPGSTGCAGSSSSARSTSTGTASTITTTNSGDATSESATKTP
jgi:hypothetical protein